MTATSKKTGFLVRNEFHAFEKFTTSERQVSRLVRASRPSDCRSRTMIYRVTAGEIVGRVDFNGDRLVDL